MKHYPGQGTPGIAACGKPLVPAAWDAPDCPDCLKAMRAAVAAAFSTKRNKP